MTTAIIRSMRPKQWTKNFFVFAGIVFTGRFVELDLLVRVVFAFLLFCALSGSVYILNDIFDLKKDREHPAKSQRPLASGQLKTSSALVTALLLIPLAIGLSFLLNNSFGLAALAYLILQIAYSVFLKHVVILDVMAVASGFVLRAVAGAVVISVEISPWLLISTALLALLLALGKRRHELLLLENNAGTHRPILAEYNPALLEQMISVVTSSTVVVYSLYSFFSETALKTHYMMLTIPFVLYGIFRYLYLVHQKGEGGSPEDIILRDKAMVVDIGLWFLTVAAIFYVS